MGNVETSSDLQEIVLSSILKDQYILGKVKNDIQVMFFDKLSYKLIYKSLLYYYNKYSQMPTLQSLSITVDDLYTTEYGSKNDIQTDLVNLYNIPINNEDFVIDQITRFIKRHRVEDVLSTYLPRIKSGESISIDQLGDDLSNSVSIDLKRSNAFRLSDVNSFSEVRRDSVGSESNPTIVKSKFSAINNSLLYKGYKLGDVVIVCAKPGCGKTMFMVNELRYASMMGYNVLHLFIGDMTKYDGFIRYASGISLIDQDKIVSMSENDQLTLIKKCNLNGHFDRIAVEAYSAGEININQLIDDVFKIQDELKMHFDVVAVDYPDNLIRESDMMYESGGEIYNKLSYLARRNKSVVFAGSQPKQNYWNSEIIPLDGCAESSKKQQVVDVMITLGRPINDCPLLTGFLAKVRRGTVGTIFRTKTEFEKANMDQISEMDYARIKADYDGSN